MAGERLVICSFSEADLEATTLKYLGRMAKEHGSDLKIVPLGDVVRGMLIEGTQEPLASATKSTHMANYFGTAQIGDSNAVVWGPSPEHLNWFERLEREGHTGKRILVSIVPNETREFEKCATGVISVLEDHVVERIFEALNS